MSLNHLLAQTATLQRLDGASDHLGNPSGVFVAVSPTLKCRLTAATANAKYSAASEGVADVSHVLFFAPGADVRKGDRVSSVLTIDGTELAPTDLDVLFIRRPTAGAGRVHHLEALCRGIKGA